MTPTRQLKPWTARDSAELYNVEGWGDGFFHIGDDGQVRVRPRADERTIDLRALVRDLRKRGLDLPMLLRFPDILDEQITRINEAFRTAITDYEYDGAYRGVFPVKVNQERHVIEEIASFGQRYAMGLEAGSKPELLIALSMLEPEDGFIICNGYKDAAFLETALLARRLGFTCIIVLERMAELDLTLEIAQRLEVEPLLGVRARLSTRGRGKWAESGGERAKFGLRTAQIVDVVEQLRAAGRLGSLRLLHYHIGSQVTAIRAVADALNEASHLYVELCRAGAPMGYLDVGGGLAIDYDGSKTNFASSSNYTIQEYASCVVDGVQRACLEAEVACPTLVSESGRALVAHQSVLVMEVLDTDEVRAELPPAYPETDHYLLTALFEACQSVTAKNFQEVFHDAVYSRDEAITLFNHGILSLADRARAERTFWCCCERILQQMRQAEYVPEELEVLERLMADTYYCNVSVFQSLPDVWAIQQVFPILPLSRLDEEPTRRAVLADVTCDSDGKIDRFVDLRDVKRVLELHPVGEKPYILGVFLVGAYQEILGDLHNLFGDTHAVHVRLDGDRYRVSNVVEGDTVGEVLSYVQYNRETIAEWLRRTTEKALNSGVMDLDQVRRLRQNFRANLDGYTYLMSTEIE